MKGKFVTFTGIFFLISLTAASLHAQWARSCGGSAEDIAYSVQQTADGGYIIAGETKSFGAGNSDIWVLKLSLAGKIEWQKTYGGNENDVARSIQQTTDNGYIIAGSTSSFGSGQSDYWILKLNSAGNVEWERAYGGFGNDVAYSVRQTSDGGYIVGGFSESSVMGTAKFWILKLTSTGTISWQRFYGGGVNDYLVSVQQTSDGKYIAAGYTNSFVAGTTKIWVLKLSSTGLIDWEQIYGGGGDDVAHSIQQTLDGGYVIVGDTKSFSLGDSDFWVLKLASNGDIDWQKYYGGSEDDIALSVQQTGDGGYIVAGYTQSFGHGASDSWVLKLTSTGDIDWQKTYGGSSDDQLNSIARTDDGGYMAAGLTTTFGAGDADFFILKLTSNGGIDPLCGLPKTSNASPAISQGFSSHTSTAPQDTNFSAQTTNLISRETSAVPNTICEFQPSLSGSVKTDEGQGLGGVTITFSNKGGTATTNSSGQYSHKLNYGWSGTATPSQTGYVFAPPNRSYTDLTSDQAGQDYTAAVVYIVSGHIRTSGGVGIDGVAITFSDEGGTATTNSSGYYSHQVKKGWSGTATPSKTCYTFSPSTRTYSNVTSNQTNQDYTATVATHIISGTVRHALTSLPMAGVVMNGLPGNPTTNASGYYEATVNCGWSGTVTPTREKFVFSPERKSYSNVTSDQIGQDYLAYPGWVISGTVQTTDGNPLPGVAVTFSDEAGSTSTDSSGNYSRTVKEGWSGTATPSKIGYTFTPVSRDYTNVTSDYSNQDYTGQLIPYTLVISAGAGGTTEPAPGSYIYDYGTQVSVKAVPESGHEFFQWSGDTPPGHEKDNPLKVTLNTNLSLQANFKKKGGCFIATAAYGSPLHPSVRILQDFRDRYLMPSRMGRKFVDLYYRYSPFCTNLIEKHRLLKISAQLNLLPLIILSYTTVHFSPFMTAVMLLFVSLLPFFLIGYIKERMPGNLKIQFFNLLKKK